MRLLRMNQMEQYVREQGIVSLNSLCDHFDVSMNTVRRDIAQLVKHGSVKKVFGGVQIVPPYQMEHIQKRETLLLEEKRRIGAYAANLVADGDVIFVDSGTTTIQMVGALQNKRNITLITNNYFAMELAYHNEQINLISLPGQLNRQNGVFTGMDQTRFFDCFNVQTAFMAAAGVSLNCGITHGSMLEADFCRYVMEKSNRTVLMVDHTKFDTVGLITYAPISMADIIITDCAPLPKYKKAFKEAGVKLVIANPL